MREKKSFLLFFLVVFAVLFVVWQASLRWNSMPYSDYILSTSLEKYDRKIVEGQGACFDLQVNVNDYRPSFARFTVRVNETIARDYEVNLAQTRSIHECLDAGLFGERENFVELELRSQRLFFHVEKTTGLEKKEQRVFLEDKGSGEVLVTIEENDEGVFAPLVLFVNGKKDHAVYPSGSYFQSTEKVLLFDGQNIVRAEFLGAVNEIVVEKKQGFAPNPFFGLFLLAGLLCAFFLLVFPRAALFERISYAIISFFAVVFVTALLLDFTRSLSALNFTLAIVAVLALVVFLFRKNLQKEALPLAEAGKVIEERSFLLLGLVFFFVFSAVFYNFFTNTYVSPFTSFYERQSETIAKLGHVPDYDSLSFFGEKPFGFFSGYFFLNAGMQWLSGFDTRSSFAVVLFLAQLCFICSAVVFFRSFGVSPKNSCLGVFVLLLGVFVFSDYLYNVRHVVADSMLLMAAVFLRKNKALESGVLAGLASFVQTPMILMFAALAVPSLETKKRAVVFVQALLVAGALLALFFAPTVIRAGFPTQAKSTTWGYLWNIPLYGFLLDYFNIFAFFAVFILPLVLTKKVFLGSFEKKLAAIILVFFFVQLFVSYRINVVISILLALLAARLFPSQFLENRFSQYALTAIFLVVLSIVSVISLGFYPLHPTAIDAFNYVRENTSTDSRFLVEPYLGHPFMFFAQRKASADLAVEYADETLIDESYRFLKEKDAQILEKNKIDYVFNRSIFLDEKPVGSNLYPHLIEFEELDKIYSNDIFFVHRARN